MSVFTNVSWQQLSAYLKNYDVGALQSYEGILAGIENSNFFVTTESGQYVLTIFERVDADDIPYFLHLTEFLSERGLPCAQPEASRKNELVSEIAGKRAALVRRLTGDSPELTSQPLCFNIGVALATMHRHSQAYPRYRSNPYDQVWYVNTGNAVSGAIASHDFEILKLELLAQSDLDASLLPRGTVHTDLFRDNVLITDDSVTGLIDFYYACTDSLLLDLATVANDWCLTDHVYDIAKENTFLAGYESVRELAPIEKEHWNLFLRRCCLRFWLSRLYDKHFPRPGSQVLVKDPDHFKELLLQHTPI